MIQRASNQGTEDEGRSSSASASERAARRRIVSGALAVGVFVVVAIVILFGDSHFAEDELDLRPVSKGPLSITIVERGTLESQSRTKIICEIDDIETDRIWGTPLLWVVANGSRVKKGDLLAEFDTSAHTERLDQQILDVQQAESAHIRAQSRLENQVTQNETTLAEAQLKVDLAKLALRQFEDENGGTFQIQVQDVELTIQEAQASKLIEETKRAGVEQLYRLGHRSQAELAQARLSSMRAERMLASAVAKKRELVAYEYRKTKIELQGAVDSAVRAKTQVERDNVAILTQGRAEADAASRALEKERERLERYQKQVDNRRVYAPVEGMVAYSSPRDSHRYHEVRAGVNIRPRQEMLSIPDLSRMQVRTFVHETALHQVKRGLKATIRVEAVPGRTWAATVKSVAVLADAARFAATGTKVYETFVQLDGEVEDLKPGMSAVIELHVAYIENVLTIPVQSIVQRRQETWCFVATDGGVERHDIELGLSNEKFVEVRSGLPEGARVVLNPDTVLASDTYAQQNELSPEDGATFPHLWAPSESDDPAWSK